MKKSTHRSHPRAHIVPGANDEWHTYSTSYSTGCSTSMRAPNARSVPTKRGKLVAMQSQSVIVDGPRPPNASTAAVIAIR